MKIALTLFLAIFITSTRVIAQEYESYNKLLDTTISSKFLGFDKNISITVPYEWQKNMDRKFPLIVIFDRQNPRSHNYIINTIDYLTSNDQMPSSIIISIESEHIFRYNETSHSNYNSEAQASDNEKFIFDEIIPMAENDLNASDYRILIGHSRYGYFTTSLLFSQLDDVDAIISLSPFFTQKNVDFTDSIQNLADYQSKSTKYYRFGIGGDYPADYHKMDSSLQGFQNASINSKGLLFKEAGHNATPGLIIAPALYEIFEEWAKSQNKYFSNDYDKIEEFNKFENEVIDHYGSKIDFSLGILNGKGWFFYNEERYNKAIEAWEIQLKSYPNFSETHLYILDAKMMMNKDLPKEEIDESIHFFKNELEKSEFYSNEEKIKLLKEVETEFK
ncbi:alpha/beta hydrolase-fold protein [Brumimicrobium mesophilum]|uniref:alpha/beta hydrolase-fold protein n=1 Tax=Brumimicrobium mesophilum TaxID=392717 RepID=UPI00131C006F|nr:alpha/beta hydrolase-fold protein [Brumimicrobium mesophilum]